MGIILTLGVSNFVFAAPVNKKLTVPNETGHTYEVFQIFTGDLEGVKLSNVTWGANGKSTGPVAQTVLDALAAIETSTADPAKVDAILSALGMEKTDLVDSSAYQKDVTAGTELSVPTGYYIVKDKDNTQNKENGEYSLLMINVVGDVTLTAKMDTPEVVKKVDDINDSNTTSTDAQLNGKSQDSADYDIGDEVPYTLTATLAQNVSAYKKYHITFVDTLESGKFSAISGLTIKLNGNTIANGEGYTVSTTGYAGDVAPSVNGFTQTVEFTPTGTYLPDSLNGAKVTIEFTATLGEGATIGMPGNENKVKLEYSNNPNDDQGGEEGTTPEDIVKVFTYQAIFDKYTTENSVKKHLAGAVFALYKVPSTITDEQVAALKEGDSLIIKPYTAEVSAGKYDSETTAVPGSVFTFKGIDDGTYVLVETTTPDGYNTAANIKFVVNATHDLENAVPVLLTLTGNRTSGIVDTTGVAKADGSNTNTAEIENNEGAELPSTGGSGTTMIYIIGVILLAGAGILLVTRRRMKAE